MIRYRRVGGMRFLRIGRLQVSWCVVRAKTAAEVKAAAAAKARRAEYRKTLRWQAVQFRHRYW